MNLTFSTEEIQLKSNVARFAATHGVRGELAGKAAHSASFRRDLWSRVAELGWLGAGLSEEQGGFGRGAVGTMIIMEEVGRGLMPEPFLPVTMSARLLAETRPQADLLANLLAGKHLIVPALEQHIVSVMGAGLSDTAAGRVLTGRRELVAGAEVADSLIVSCSTPNGAPALVAVQVDEAGISLEVCRTMDGRRAATVTFDAVALPEDAILATGDAARAALACAQDVALAALCAEATGIASFLVEQTLDYLKTRHQFGRPIGHFQALQHRVADMFVALEEARSLTIMAAVKLALKDPAERARASSAARIGAISRAMHIAREAIQLHGGVGMTEELPIGAGFKRIKTLSLLFGGEHYHLDRITAEGVS